MEKKRINLNIIDGPEFFAHETSINFSPTQFVLDFKTITPRIDPRSKEAHHYVIRHNVIMLDPYHAKKLHELLSDAIKNYEKEFGKIEKPKQIKKLEKKAKQKKQKKKEPTTPAYLG